MNHRSLKVPMISGKAWLIRALVAGLVTFPGFAPRVLAWGEDGHRIVGIIAQAHISTEVSRKLANNFNINFLADIAPWADKVKKDRSQQTWHYANIEKGKKTYRQQRDCPDRQCVTEKIRDFVNILQAKNYPASVRREALAYLVHLVADIHQPLHLGNRSDRGGNGITVRVHGKPTNLHALWDHGLILKKGKTLAEYARRLPCNVTPGDRFSPARLPVDAWANGSRALALQYAYPVEFSQGRELTPRYIRSGQKIVERQLCRAGIRLAVLLNGILSE